MNPEIYNSKLEYYFGYQMQFIAYNLALQDKTVISTYHSQIKVAAFEEFTDIQ